MNKYIEVVLTASVLQGCARSMIEQVSDETALNISSNVSLRNNTDSANSILALSNATTTEYPPSATTSTRARRDVRPVLVDRDFYGYLEIQVSVDNGPYEDHMLTFSNDARFGDQRVTNFRVGGRTIPSERHYRSSERGSRFVGMGPRSDLVRTIGSVDLINNTPNGDILLLGAGEADFLDSCLDGSMMRFPYQEMFGRGIQTRISLSSLTSQPEMLMTLEFSSDLAVVSAPGSILSPIFEILGPDQTDVVFDCASVKPRLPNIVIELVGALDDDVGTGALVLTPDDYLLPNGDSCFVYVYQKETENVVEVNPLFIPNMNVRVTADEILICDAADE